ncbi:molecular chaperone DnaJ [Bythopirellula goksoeyrii]|uniref:Chaperone protein DnaJ n=1 Tax=Bythopirellula goksoeyrii TaxID=1400387 RepID=A0A5B9Q4U7_9BACT|nr:molecular chaperone DnaJ [Bythopirellula goksoeyrii]QEG34064.1 Chaperone protein DnaJ [Bythopirellula goksoeyrii]
MTEKRCYYEVLQVERTASTGEIATAYRKLAVTYHPDKNPGDQEAIDRFKEASEAFEVLHDPDKRARYDRFGHAGMNGQGGAGHFSDVEDIFSAFGDIFGDLFGGGRSRRSRVRKGRDVRCTVTLTLQEAAQGVRKKVEFQRHEPCDTCEGSGATKGSKREKCSYCGGQGQVIQQAGIIRVQTTCPACQGEGSSITSPCKSCRGTGQRLKSVEAEVQIPAGVDEGMQVRITGQGEPSPNGGPSGDCYCFVSVLQHPLFEREGRHLICRIPITYSQAALGCTLEVPTLSGPGTVDVPRGTQSGDVFRMEGEGLPDPRIAGLGDLLVQVNIEVPKKLTDDEERLLRELAEIEHKNVAPERKGFFDKVKEYFKHETVDS